MIRWLVLFMLVSSGAYASEIVCWDAVTERITRYQKSAHTPDYSSNPLCLINPDLSGVDGVSRSDWLHDFGIIRGMTQSEKDLIITEQKNLERASVNGFNISAQELAKALADLGIVDGPTLKQKLRQNRGL